MNSQLNMEHVDGLLPCPWCGKVPDANDSRTFWVDDSVGGKWGAVQCCGIGPDVRTGYGPVEEWRDDAIAAWNTRAAGGEARVVELEQQLAAARREVPSEEMLQLVLNGLEVHKEKCDKYLDRAKRWTDYANDPAVEEAVTHWQNQLALYEATLAWLAGLDAAEGQAQDES